MKENSSPLPTDLILIRHAPAATGGRLCGRTDVPILPIDPVVLDVTRRAIGPVDRRMISPAQRCRQTAEALWPGAAVECDARLWEQDFGAWDGTPVNLVPDLGPLSRGELALHAPPDGESFAAMCKRVQPAIMALAGTNVTIAMVVHAGTVRAALALALGDPAAALAFDIAPLSVTRMTLLGGGAISIRCVGAGGVT